MAVEQEDRQVARVLISAYEACWGPGDWNHYRAELSDTAARRIHGVVLVARTAGAVVGTVTVIPPTSGRASGLGSSSAEMRMLAVAPRCQGQGIGEELVRAAGEVSVGLGLGEVALHSDEDLVAAHRLYQRLGFLRDPVNDMTLAGGIVAHCYRLGLPLPARGSAV